MKIKKSKPFNTLYTICRVCNAALYYNDDCGCLECIICEQKNKIKNEKQFLPKIKKKDCRPRE